MKSNLYQLLEYCEKQGLATHFSHVKATLTIYADTKINQILYQAKYDGDLDNTAQRALIWLEKNYEKQKR